VCEFWDPIREGVMVLLPPDQIAGGFRRTLGPSERLDLPSNGDKTLDLKVMAYSYYVRMSEFREQFDVAQQPLVVDVGCSTGSFSMALGPDQLYFGLDISLRSLAFARRSTGQLYAQADAERLPLKTKAVPFFTSRETLEHLSNPDAGVAELRRIGQRGVIELPTLDYPFLYDPVNYVLRPFGKRAKFGIYGYDHHHLHDVAGWRQLLQDGGFQVGREAAIGTGLALNGGDVFWHAVFSWRDFDSLPRNGVPTRLLAPLFKFYSLAHRVDKSLYPRGASHGYEVW
jgi:SAM-dependent methyltransferase